MARTLSNEATELEKDELKDLLQQDGHLQQQYAMLQQFWHPGQATSSSSSDLQKLFQRARQIESKTPPEEVVVMKQPRFRRIYWLAAAAVLLIVFSSFFLFHSQPAATVSEQVVYNDSISTQQGNRSQLILPDGSRVWLNAGSRLLYQRNFSGKLREVQLIGEAYFDVVKMPAKPFIVHAEGVNIRVLGTAFNVKCYPGDDKIETTLIRGAVAVSDGNHPENKTIYLRPNEKLSISRQPVVPEERTHTAFADYRIENIDTAILPSAVPETAWVYNRLEFRDLSFKALAVKMERWYNVKITFGDAEVQQLRFIGSFETETIDEALSALQAVAAFSYKINGHEILIKSSK
ncbi:MAG TPA: FecR domain-containing protein [Chitinophagaceae bacterium]